MIDVNVEEIYQMFARYPKRELVDADPLDCSAGDGFSKRISTGLVERPLRSLTGAELGEYLFHAVSHVGDADDLRHYLPRILELVSVGELPGSVLLQHLETAEARAWPAEERMLLLQFFKTHPRALGDLGTIELVQELLGAA